MVNPNKQLEQIQIPKFLANKVKYVTRRAAFSSCIDETSLSPQFKILQWESHLANGRDGERIKLFTGSVSSENKIELKVWRK